MKSRQSKGRGKQPKKPGARTASRGGQRSGRAQAGASPKPRAAPAQRPQPKRARPAARSAASVVAPSKRAPVAASKAVTKPAPKAASKPARAAAPQVVLGSRSDPAVQLFLAKLDHPLKHDIARVRDWILAAHPSITEAIKWNGPSFATGDFFATIHWRPTDSVRVILHRGAKPRPLPADGLRLRDREGLVSWLAKDRCLVTLGTGSELAGRAELLRGLVREWIRQL